MSSEEISCSPDRKKAREAGRMEGLGFRVQGFKVEGLGCLMLSLNPKLEPYLSPNPCYFGP